MLFGVTVFLYFRENGVIKLGATSSPVNSCHFLIGLKQRMNANTNTNPNLSSIEDVRNPSSLQATADVKHPKAVLTKKDRRLQSAKLFIIASVSIVTVVLTIIDVVFTAKAFEKESKLIYKVQGSADTAIVIHNLQQERDLTALQYGLKILDLNLGVKNRKYEKKGE